MPGALNIDVDPLAKVDVVADANALPFQSAHFAEVHAINAYGFYPVTAEVTRVMQSGAELWVTGTARNKYAAALTVEQAEALGLEIVRSGPMDSEHAFGTLAFTSGAPLSPRTSTTTIYCKK